MQDSAAAGGGTILYVDSVAQHVFYVQVPRAIQCVSIVVTLISFMVLFFVVHLAGKAVHRNCSIQRDHCDREHDLLVCVSLFTYFLPCSIILKMELQ